MRFAPTKIVIFPRHGNCKVKKLFFIKSNKNCIGVQVLNLRFRMTGHDGGGPYRFFTFRSELEMNSVRIFRKIFHPRCGLSERGSNFSIKISPLPGVSNLYKHSSSRRKRFGYFCASKVTEKRSLRIASCANCFY